METKDVLDLLKDDANYYGDLGQKYLSNSNIEVLLKDPKSFGKPTAKTVEMLFGNFVHELVFFGASNIPHVDASTRNTKIYKDAYAENGGILLLQKEVQEGYSILDTINGVPELQVLYNDDNQYEIPAIGDILGSGIEWKGKADIICPERNQIIDLKTTSNIDSFGSKARLYNYDSQAWIYKQLFGMDVCFLAIEKGTHRIKWFEVSDETLDRGRDKVVEAEQNYKDFFLEKTQDPNHFVQYGII